MLPAAPGGSASWGRRAGFDLRDAHRRPFRIGRASYPRLSNRAALGTGEFEMATGFADRCPMGANLCVRGLQEVNETMTRPPHRRGRGGLAGRISHVRLSPTSCTPRPPVEVPLTLASLERQRLLGTRLPAAEFPIGAPHARLFARKTEPARSPARGARPSGPGTRETDARRACGRRLPSRETGPRPRPRPRLPAREPPPAGPPGICFPGSRARRPRAARRRAGGLCFSCEKPRMGRSNGELCSWQSRP